MIFKQIDKILSGQKTQTRRVVKPGERLSDLGRMQSVCGPGVRCRWITGRTYAVVPKRGMPGVWWRPVDGGVELLHEHPDRATWRLALENLKARGFQPLRIRILAIRQERLQDITEADAKAEGVADVEAYRALWQAINGKTPGARWAHNPQVFVLEFELVRETQS